MGLLYNPNEDTLMSRSEIWALPTPPAMGRFHQPYSFGDYIEDVTDSFRNMSLRIVREEFAVTNDGNRFFGLMHIEGGDAHDDAFNYVVGLRGSHDQRIPRGLVLGTRVLVCSNLCFHGDIAEVKTKQTLNMVERLPQLLNDTVNRLPDLMERQSRIFENMRNTNLTDNFAKRLLVDMYQQGAFSSPQLTRAIDEYFEPTHAEHMAEGRTLWTLFNAATESIKPTGSNVNHMLVEQRTRVVSSLAEQCIAEAA